MAKVNEVSPVKTEKAIEIFFRVWSGENVTQACDANQSVRRMFYKWCEVHGVDTPKKGAIVKKHEQKREKMERKITKKTLADENLKHKIKLGIYQNAEFDASWAKTGIQFLEAEAKGQGGTFTPKEYGELIEEIFKPHLNTCQKCGAVIDGKKAKSETNDNKAPEA